MKFVTIIIPCRNEERYIGKCLESIINNDYPKDDLEVLVIDGMSEDMTRDIIGKYTQQYSFINLFDNFKKIAPTDVAVENLRKEGITKNVYKVGDVMFDIALKVKKKFIDKEKLYLSRFGLETKRFILITIHRAENTDIRENLENIWNALIEIARKGIKMFFPVHPRTLKALEKFNLLKVKIPENMIISEPVGYAKMITLESNARLIITDSGGVQKEGYFFKTQCVIVRNETEWTELVDSGWNKIVGNKKENIVNTVLNMLNGNFIDKKWIAFYGNGNSSEKIVKLIQKIKGIRSKR